MTETSTVELGELGFDRGAHVLVRRAFRGLRPGQTLLIRGSDPTLVTSLWVFARGEGHRVLESTAEGTRIEKGSASRHAFAERAGSMDPSQEGAVVDTPNPAWGLAARGALVEAGGPKFDFPLQNKDEVWTDDAGRLYAQAAAAQWDPATAIPWSTPLTHDDVLEEAVVQVMTYLIENETAALLVPARFLSRLHPHFREVAQLLAIQTADEARHIEVFTRRAALRGHTLSLSTVGGQASLKSLIDEPDFALASFLLSVLGEGTFLDLLQFLRENAPDRVTSEVVRLAAQDEARHVAFGMSHLERHLALDPSLRGRLEQAVVNRQESLAQTAGLNDEVFDALIVLAAKGLSPDGIQRGFEAVLALVNAMDRGRQMRLRRLGWDDVTARELSSRHTRNFM